MRVLVTLALLPLLLACEAAPPETTNPDLAQVEADVRREIAARAEAWREAILRGDPQGVASFWTSDALWLEPGMRVTGSEMLAFLQEFFDGAGSTALESEEVDLFLDGDAAYPLGPYDETIQFEGQEPFTVHNYHFIRWEKEDGIWKIDRLLAGPRSAPPEG